MNDMKLKLYKKNLQKLNFLFESLEDEEMYLYSNHKWLVNMTPDTRDYYSFKIDEHKTLLFSDGDIAIVSNTLFESSDGSWFSSIWSFFTHSYDNLKEFFELLLVKQEFSNVKLLLGLGTLLEIINLVLALITPIGKGVSTIITVIISMAFTIGGLILIANGMKGKKVMLSPQDSTETLTKKLKEIEEATNTLIEGWTSLGLALMTIIMATVPSIQAFSKTAAHWLEGLVGSVKGFIKNGLITFMKKVLNISTHGVAHMITHTFCAMFAAMITAIGVKAAATLHMFENKKYQKRYNMLFENDGDGGSGISMSAIFSNPGKVINDISEKFKTTTNSIITSIGKVDLGVIINNTGLIKKLVDVLKWINSKIWSVVGKIKDSITKLGTFIKDVYTVTKIYLDQMDKSKMVLGGTKNDFGVTGGVQKPIEKDVIKKEVAGLSKDKDKQEKFKGGIEKVVVDNSNLKNILSFDNFLNEQNLNFNN